MSTMEAPARAALYVRMSREHQAYSIANQTAALVSYAAERGYEIIRIYSDAGLSGLSLKGRDGLQALLADVIGGKARFNTILTYDVSRWGRFQDPDQSAHYEFLCRQAGVRIEYCAESFVNDDSLGSVVAKALKRAVAADFSRSLSRRVSEAQRRIRTAGYWTGGPAPFGLRRQLLDEADHPLAVLERGDQKALQRQRVVLIPGPAAEQATVRRIFKLYADDRLVPRAIAETLTNDGAPAGAKRVWSASLVRLILRDALYVGRFVANRFGGQLGGPREKRPLVEWETLEGFVEPILDSALFERAQRRMGQGPLRLTDDEMIAGLRRLRGQAGRLNGSLIKKDRALPGPGSFRTRFGSLPAAYDRVGVKRTRQSAAPRMGPFASRLAELLEADQHQPRCARLSGSALWAIMVTEGYQGSLGTVRTNARAWRRHQGLPLQPRTPSLGEAELLNGLRRILAETGRLDTYVINADRFVPCVRIYARTFGSLSEAYRRIGYTPIRTYDRPKLGPFQARLEELIARNASLGGKDRLPSTDMWRALVSEGFTGGPWVVQKFCKKANAIGATQV
jgi:DNA invertase Pin-like site-specific DNA recombinase